MPVELIGRFSISEASSLGRLSSFGFSGTIAHALFELGNTTLYSHSTYILASSLFRSQHLKRQALSELVRRMNLVYRAQSRSHGSDTSLTQEYLSFCAHSTFLDHVVGGNVLLPDVGFLEMTLVAAPDVSSSMDISDTKFV
jgi:hypothetical protein